ncbi:MAG: DUF4430 domain-containing protein [Clostridiales Family XIII bacterium]|nr:DUF4430 domain-containing protein [Clostridiales Family XIII bacterium]
MEEKIMLKKIIDGKKRDGQIGRYGRNARSHMGFLLRNVLLAAAIIIMVFTMAACGQSGGDAASDAKAQAAQDVATPAAVTPAEEEATVAAIASEASDVPAAPPAEATPPAVTTPAAVTESAVTGSAASTKDKAADSDKSKEKSKQKNTSKSTDKNTGKSTDKSKSKDKSKDESAPTSAAPAPQPATGTTQPEQASTTVTLSIECATILNNMDKLAKGKDGLVGNGTIMAAKKVTLQSGDSVFDVLVRECKAAKIHMEYESVPMYNSSYIEGINNLYEFDCGELSGWMYSVNNVYPNYGCSQYTLKDGDVIKWRYTCDLGKDIGGAGVVQR